MTHPHLTGDPPCNNTSERVGKVLNILKLRSIFVYAACESAICSFFKSGNLISKAVTSNRGQKKKVTYSVKLVSYGYTIVFFSI